MLDDPFQRAGYGASAHEADLRRLAGALHPVENLIRRQEKSFEKSGAWFFRIGIVVFLAAAGEEFVETARGRQGPRRAPRRQYGDGHQRRPRPLCEIVNRKNEPVREEDHFRRQVRRFLPRPLADQRQPIACEDANIFKTAFGQNPFARFRHMGRVLALAHGAERRIGLNRRVDVASGRVMINLPGAVLALGLAQALRKPRAQMMVFQPHKPESEYPLRLHTGVGFKPAHPVAFGFLPRSEPVRRRFDGARKLPVEIRAPFRRRFLFVEHPRNPLTPKRFGKAFLARPGLARQTLIAASPAS